MGCLGCKTSKKKKEKKAAGIWVPASNGHIPKNAFIGGWLSNDYLYIIRAKHEKTREIYGYLNPEDRAASISTNLAFKKDNYEVLCNAKGKWEPINLKSDEIPRNAISGRQDSKKALEDLMYIGRVKRGNDYIPGYLDPKKKRIFIPYKDDEEEFTSGEILVIGT